MSFKRSNLEKQVLELPKEVKWCKKCLMSNQRPRIFFDNNGICSGCINNNYKKSINWEKREQLLFKSSEYGDDSDRALKKSDGTWTYFATDMAYHLDKMNRTKGDLINVLGADHIGYISRINAAVSALSNGSIEIDTKVCALVNLLEDGKPIKMSKRAGNFVTLSEIINAVGKDVVRFIMLTRRNDQSLDFDFKKVMEKSKENPMLY